jgi:hypothetical protein
MITYILSRLKKRYPYHFSVGEDRVTMVLLMSEDLNENTLLAMDLMEELGFKLKEQKKLSVATGGPKMWTQLSYEWVFKKEKLPKGELSFLNKYLESNSNQKREMLTTLS